MSDIDNECHLVLYTESCNKMKHKDIAEFEIYLNDKNTFGKPVRLETRSNDIILSTWEMLTGYKGWVKKECYQIDHFIDYTDILPVFSLKPWILYKINDNSIITIQQTWIETLHKENIITDWREVIKVELITLLDGDVKVDVLKEFLVDRDSIIEAIDYFIEQSKITDRGNI